jgi:hypothetical protein
MGLLSKASALAIGTVSVLGATAGLAQPSPRKSESVTLLTLIAAGYEIKNVLFVPFEAMRPIGYDPSIGPQVIVTLQKDASTAACNFAVIHWLSQNPSSLENPALCQAYNFK